jgi:hypothetical protein
MLLFNCTNLKSESPMLVKKFVIIGDGESKVLHVDLEKSPVGMEFRGAKYPAYVFMRGSIGPEVMIRMETSYHVGFEFSRPPAKGERTEIDVEFFYEGESNG